MQPSRIAQARQPLLLLFVLLLAPVAAEATPQFARRYERSCGSCHSLPPALNERGLAFQASGYQLPGPQQAEPRERAHLLPMAAWLTARFEDQAGGAADLFLPKVELISGGRFGQSWSYFAEWRPVSLSLRADGSLQDRGGRFEDLFVERALGDRHAVRVGQFRSLNQVDVSLRLSASEPLLFNHGLPTGTRADPRLAGLDRFSPAARSPAVGYSLRSLPGASASDGLFTFVTLPFVGELSIPLSPAASRDASFELHGPPKGVYLESFYRRGLSSLGGHVFVADEGWLATALGVFSLDGWALTGGAGRDERDGADPRWRGSAQLERVFDGPRGSRAAPGLRVEDVSGDGNRAAIVPYFAVAAPNTRYTYLLQLEWRSEERGDSFVIDLSALF
jgi:hypothetical protein